MSASATTLPTHRKRRLPRVDSRVAVGVLLMAVAVLGGSRILATADDTVSVVAAAHDLPANHRLRASDLTVARVRVPGGVLAGLVRASGREALVGRVVLGAVPRAGLLTNSGVGDTPAAGRDVTIPVDPGHALGGALRAGDRVDVLATFGVGTREARTLTVVAGAEVVDMIRAHGVFGQGDGSLTALTLSVAPDDAVFVAFAARNGELDVVRATGAPAATRQRFELGQIP